MDCIQVTKKGKKIVVVCVPRGVSTFSIKRVLLRSSKKCTSDARACRTVVLLIKSNVFGRSPHRHRGYVSFLTTSYALS